MFGYVLRRLLTAVVVLLITSFLTFALFFKGPTNPAKAICEQNGRCTPAKQAAIEHAMGLDEGLMTNYPASSAAWSTTARSPRARPYHCDAPCLGVSFRTKQEVSKAFLEYYPATLSLAVGGGLLYLLIGVPLGVIAARFRGTLFDKVLGGRSADHRVDPVLRVRADRLDLPDAADQHLPDHAVRPDHREPGRAWFAGLLLPWLVLGITGAPTYARYARGQMLETMGEDYIRTGKAKGLSERKLLFKHSLRVAMVPIVTIFGLDFAALLAGTIFTESIFGINGIGQWTLNSLRPPDFPILTATILIFAVFVIVANIIVDLLYAVLDPRVRLA